MKFSCKKTNITWNDMYYVILFRNAMDCWWFSNAFRCFLFFCGGCPISPWGEFDAARAAGGGVATTRMDSRDVYVVTNVVKIMYNDVHTICTHMYAIRYAMKIIVVSFSHAQGHCTHWLHRFSWKLGALQTVFRRNLNAAWWSSSHSSR